MLRKLLTVSMLFVLIASISLAGNTRKGARVQKARAITGEEAVQTAPTIQRYRPATYTSGPGDSIGFTTYDYGSNGSVNHNIVNYGDGTFSVGRMAATDPGTADRGTWYSYFNGTSWSPLTKVEAGRRGWGNIAQMADALGIEVTLSHTGNRLNVHSEKGAAGTWTESVTGGTALWPKLAIGSGFTVHAVNMVNPPAGTPLYTRSQDAGITFDKRDATAFTLGGASADAYDIAAQGTNVAIIDVAEGSDVVLITSTDNGETWTEQVIYDVADGAGELLSGQEQPQPDGAGALIYDNAGNVHAVWGNYLAVGDASNTAELFYSINAPIMHWSAATGISDVALPVQDTTLYLSDGGPGRDGNYATDPDIGVDANNNLYVVFTSVINESTPDTVLFTHVFAAASGNGGANWGPAVDVTPGTGHDATYPAVADWVDSDLHIVYNSDALPGTSLQGTHAVIEVAIRYLKVPSSDVLVSVREVPGQVPSVFRLEQNYPNPFNPATKIEYSIPAKSLVTLKVYNLLGEEVATLVNGEQDAGTYVADFEAAKLSSGVYLYKLQAGSFAETKKMMLMK